MTLCPTHKFKTGQINCELLRALIEYQEGKPLKLAPKLTRNTIDPKRFSTMNIRGALHVLSQSDYAGLTFMANELHPDDGNRALFDTTAWF